MATFFFHCASTQEVLPDRRGSELEDLSEAQGRAFQIIRALLASDLPQDWREWTVHVSDDDGEELLLVPFSSILGRLH